VKIGDTIYLAIYSLQGYQEYRRYSYSYIEGSVLSLDEDTVAVWVHYKPFFVKRGMIFLDRDSALTYANECQDGTKDGALTLFIPS
jgi:hypothetical protein